MPTTTHPAPDVPLPPGAVPDAEGWGFWDNQFRIFHGPDRTVSDAAGQRIIAEVRTGGIQLPDGSVDPSEPPTADVNVFTDDGLTAAQARALAAALTSAAAELDGWAGK